MPANYSLHNIHIFVDILMLSHKTLAIMRLDVINFY